jgi:hypothetical protein
MVLLNFQQFIVGYMVPQGRIFQEPLFLAGKISVGGGNLNQIAHVAFGGCLAYFKKVDDFVHIHATTICNLVPA